MNQIKNQRKKLGLTQTQLADMLGVSQSAIAMWESGKNMPRADMLQKLSRILNCSIDDLFQSDKSA